MKEECIIICVVVILFVGIPILITSINGEEVHMFPHASEQQQLSLTVLYDNYAYREDVQTAWGFACVIQGAEQTIFFDTGADGSILSANMKACGIDPSTIEVIVISHEHWDHRGGIYTALANTGPVRIYIPQSFSASFKADLKRYGREIIEVQSPLKICGQVYSTGDLEGAIREQALIIQTHRGAIVITGCAHPGIVNIVRKAKEVVHDDILLVLGGFHLLHTPRHEIEGIISEFKQMGVRYVGPSHCSGDLARTLFQETYCDQYVTVGAGRVIHAAELP